MLKQWRVFSWKHNKIRKKKKTKWIQHKGERYVELWLMQISADANSLHTHGHNTHPLFHVLSSPTFGSLSAFLSNHTFCPTANIPDSCYSQSFPPFWEPLHWNILSPLFFVIFPLPYLPPNKSHIPLLLVMKQQSGQAHKCVNRCEMTAEFSGACFLASHSGTKRRLTAQLKANHLTATIAKFAPNMTTAQSVFVSENCFGLKG